VDLLGVEEAVDAAVARVVCEGVDAVDGEGLYSRVVYNEVIGDSAMYAKPETRAWSEGPRIRRWSASLIT